MLGARDGDERKTRGRKPRAECVLEPLPEAFVRVHGIRNFELAVIFTLDNPRDQAVRAQVVGKLVGSADALEIDVDVAHRSASAENVPPEPSRRIGLSALRRALNYGADPWSEASRFSESTDSPPSPQRDSGMEAVTEEDVSMTGRRVLLFGVAALLSLSALLAIGILVVGRFGSVEARILGSTALLAGFGLVALPAVMLLDKERARVLAYVAAALPAVAAGLALVLIWSRSDSEALGRSLGSATIVALAFAQLAAMTARRTERDDALVRRLFALSCGTGLLGAAVGVALLWIGPDNQRAPRLFGALLVLDLLLVALQPLLARARAGSVLRRITVVDASGEQIEFDVAARDVASAAARAIRSAERSRGGCTVAELKITAPRTGGSP